MSNYGYFNAPMWDACSECFYQERAVCWLSSGHWAPVPSKANIDLSATLHEDARTHLGRMSAPAKIGSNTEITQLNLDDEKAAKDIQKWMDVISRRRARKAQVKRQNKE